MFTFDLTLVLAMAKKPLTAIPLIRALLSKKRLPKITMSQANALYNRSRLTMAVLPIVLPAVRPRR